MRLVVLAGVSSIPDAVARVRAAPRAGGIDAVLWLPDGGVSGATELPGQMRQLVLVLRRDLGLAETVPFLVAAPDDESGELLAPLAATTPYVGLVAARGGPLSLDDEAPLAFGDRCFRMWRSMVAVSPAKLEAQAAKYRNATRVRANVLLDPGEFLVTSPFGRRTHPVTGEEQSFHAGVDGALWNGRMLLETGICAWRDGVVAEAADTEGPAGTCVLIDHGGGVVSRSFHLERGSLRVAAGDRVRAGDLLGWMGKTGRATGEHLHFQLERDGVPVDPLPHLALTAARR